MGYKLLNLKTKVPVPTERQKGCNSYFVTDKCGQMAVATRYLCTNQGLAHSVHKVTYKNTNVSNTFQRASADLNICNTSK